MKFDAISNHLQIHFDPMATAIDKLAVIDYCLLHVDSSFADGCNCMVITAMLLLSLFGVILIRKFH